MILHLLHMRRNVNRNVFNDRKNVSATTGHVISHAMPRWMSSRFIGMCTNKTHADMCWI